MAGYRSKKIMADRYADPITLDHIIELKKKLAEAEQQRDNALNACMSLRKQIDTAYEALKFYANRKHYDLFVRSHSSMGEYETSFIQDDGGQIAREVLGEK